MGLKVTVGVGVKQEIRPLKARKETVARRAGMDLAAHWVPRVSKETRVLVDPRAMRVNAVSRGLWDLGDKKGKGDPQEKTGLRARPRNKPDLKVTKGLLGRTGWMGRMGRMGGMGTMASQGPRVLRESMGKRVAKGTQVTRLA
jgi:hypothetical protein